jgi:hypothetical protein
MWSKPDAIVPDEPLRWILATLRFYAIVASVGMALAFMGISILASASAVLHHKVIVSPIGTGRIDRIEGGGATMVVLIALIILFGAATYFTGRWLDGKAGLTTGGIACVIILIALWALSGFGFG